MRKWPTAKHFTSWLSLAPGNYRRLAARVRKAKAVTATARKLAVLFYNALRFGVTYADPGTSYYEERYRHRVIHNLQRRAKDLGFTLVATPTGNAGVS